MEAKLTIHYPKNTGNSVGAAITHFGSSKRLVVDVYNLCVSDKDANWTRCYSLSGPDSDCFSGIQSAEQAVQLALEQWVVRHADELEHNDSKVLSSVKRVGDISFFMFRNGVLDDMPSYEVGDKGKFAVELRELRRSSNAGGYTLIWRAIGFEEEPCANEEDESVDEQIDEPKQAEEQEEDAEPTEEQEEDAEPTEEQEEDAEPAEEQEEDAEPAEENTDNGDILARAQRLRDEMDVIIDSLKTKLR